MTPVPRLPRYAESLEKAQHWYYSESVGHGALASFKTKQSAHAQADFSGLHDDAYVLGEAHSCTRDHCLLCQDSLALLCVLWSPNLELTVQESPCNSEVLQYYVTDLQT